MVPEKVVGVRTLTYAVGGVSRTSRHSGGPTRDEGHRGKVYGRSEKVYTRICVRACVSECHRRSGPNENKVPDALCRWVRSGRTGSQTKFRTVVSWTTWELENEGSCMRVKESSKVTDPIHDRERHGVGDRVYSPTPLSQT